MTVTFRTGALDVAGLHFAGSLLLSDGRLQVGGASEIAGSLEQSGGELGGAGDLRLKGSARWTGGSHIGSGRTIIDPGVTLRIDGSANKLLNGRTLENHGNIQWQDAGGLLAFNGARIENLGVFDAQNDATTGYVPLGGAVPLFHNAGAIRKTGGGGETVFRQQFFQQEGVFEVLSGSLRIEGGTVTNRTLIQLGANTQCRVINSSQLTLADGSGFAGEGRLQLENATLLAEGNSTMARLDQVGGRQTGAGTITVTDSMNWSGGELAGAGRTRIAAGATLVLTGNEDKLISGRTLENRGLLLWQDTGGLRAYAGGQIEDYGVLEARSDATLGYNSFGGPLPSFLNAGTFRKSGGTGETVLTQIASRLTGNLEVRTGTVRLLSSAVTLAPTHTMAFTIHGRTAGTEHGRLLSDRPLPLMGTLAVTLDDAFVPASEDVFNLIQGNPIAGIFTLLTAAGGDAPVGLAARYTNNTVQVSLDSAPLQLRAVQARIPEDGGPVKLTVARRIATPTPLLVTLDASPTGRLTVPPKVTIPANLSVVEFEVQPIRDGLPGPDLPVTLTATAGALPATTLRLILANADSDELRVTIETNRVVEGRTVAATIERSGAGTQPVEVFLSSSDSSRLLVPGSVVLGAGEAARTFALIAVDDTELTGDEGVSVTATSAVHRPARANVTVLENDIPAVALTLAASTVSERAGPNATTATLTPTPAGNRPLAIALESSDPTLVLVPGLVTIPGGQASASFPVAVMNDTLVNGSRRVVLVPTLLVGGVPFRQGTGAALEVTDDDGPALFVKISPRIVGPGIVAAATGIVTRNTSTNGPLVVALAGDALATATVPSSVTIPAGTNAAPFSVRTLNVGIPGGTQAVTVTATADGYTSGVDVLMVTDLSLPDLIVSRLSTPSAGDTEAVVQANYRVENQGRDVAHGPIRTRLFLSDDPVLGNDRLLNEHTFPGDVAAGQFYETTVSYFLPRQAGDYWLIAVTDVANAVGELLEDNNTTVSATPIHVGSAYVAAVETDLKRATAGTPVPLRGRAFLRDSAEPAPFALVSLHIMLRGTDRVIAVLCDEDGGFATTFKPLPGEAGHYTIAATHPGVTGQPAPQDSFTLVGFSATPSPVNLTLTEKVSTTLVIELENLADIPLTDLRALVATNNLPNVEFALALDHTNLAANGKVLLTLVATLTLLLTPPADLALGRNTGQLAVSGALASVPISFEFRSLSDVQGGLRVTVNDEFTFYAEGSPHVTNAVVNVRDAFSGGLVTNGVTGPDGVVQFSSLAEGYYDLEVIAEKHTRPTQRTFVNAGIPNEETVFASLKLIDFHFTVVPTEIDDRTKIVIETTFETFVPAPVITIAPAFVDVNDLRRPEDVIVFTIENHGLVAGQRAHFTFESTDELEITPLTTELGDIPAMGSIAVPVRYRFKTPARPNPFGSVRGGAQLAANAATPPGNCGSGRVDYILICGVDQNLYTVPLPTLGCQEGGGGSGGGGGGGGFGTIGIAGGGANCPNCFVRYTFDIPGREPITNACAPCDPRVFKKKCKQIEKGAKIDALAKALAGLISKIPGVSLKDTSASISAKANGCTCCDAETGGISIEGSASGEAQIGAKFSFPIAGGPGLSTEQDLGDGYKAVITLSPGTLDLGVDFMMKIGGSIEAKCALREEKVCAYASASLAPKLTASIGASVSISGPGGISTNVEAKAEVSLSTSFNGNVRQCTDGKVTGNLCLDPIKLSAHAGFNIPGFPAVNFDYSTNLTAKQCLNPETPAGAEFPEFAALVAELNARAGHPETLTAWPAIPVRARPAGDTSAGLCARVKLRLDQEAVLTRQAFNATLELDNQDAAAVIAKIEVQLNITDDAGADRASDLASALRS